MIKVSDIRQIDLGEDKDKLKLSLLLAAATYESRCIHVPGLMRDSVGRKVLLVEGNDDRRKVQLNIRQLKKYGFEELKIVGTEEDTIQKLLETALENAMTGELPVIAIDASCFSRKTLANIVAAVVSLCDQRSIQLILAYSLASYVPPPTAEMATNKEVYPVHPAFSGWTSSPGMPVASVVGLGYERDKAIGAVEYLQASNWWLFEPESEETSYRPKMEEHNKRIIEATPLGRRILYDVLRPVDTLIGLESLVAGLKRDFKPILLPFGPKIFFALSLLVSAVHPEAAVWFVSGEDEEPEVDRKPSKFTTAISVLLSKV